MLGHFGVLIHSCPMNGTVNEVISLGEKMHLNEIDLSTMFKAGTIWRVLSRPTTK